VKALNYKIRQVHLKNIKSHVDTTLEFSSGINIIEGDVGSGKSTILQSIEAALFGYDITKLIRVNEENCQIVLKLEPDLQIEWNVRSKKNQGARVLINGELHTLTAKEMREFVVKKLRIPESTGWREPKLFRAAVYIRQEELKTLLDESTSAEELVRRATGVTKFSVAVQNAKRVNRQLDTLSQALRNTLNLVQSRVERNKDAEENLKRYKAQLEEELATLETLEKMYQELEQKNRKAFEEYSLISNKIHAETQALKSFEEDLGITSEQRQSLEKEVKALEDELLAQEAPKLLSDDLEEINSKLKELQRELARVNREKGVLENQKRQLSELEKEKQALESEIDFGLDLDALTDSVKKLDQKKEELLKEIAKLESLIQGHSKLVQTGECYVCGAKVDTKSWKKHLEEEEQTLNRLKIELDNAERELESVRENQSKAKLQIEKQKRLEKVANKIEEIRQSLEKEKSLEEEEKRLSEEVRELNEAQRFTLLKNKYEEKVSRLEEIKKREQSLKERIAKLKRSLEQNKAELERVSLVYSQTKEEFDKVRKQREESLKSVERLKELVQSEQRRVEEYKRDLEEQKRIAQKLETLSKLRGFFEKSFIPTLEKIEALRLEEAKSRISVKMKEYFDLLMQDDERTVELTDELKPVLKKRIAGEWVEMPYPSGGERSTIALSYRLALGCVAREMRGIGVDFMMLDEPTDGFSEEQLTKFQMVLERLEIPQIILVSHHKALESIGQTIIRVEYSKDGSVVSVSG